MCNMVQYRNKDAFIHYPEILPNPYHVSSVAQMPAYKNVGYFWDPSRTDDPKANIGIFSNFGQELLRVIYLGAYELLMPSHLLFKTK